MSPAHTATPGHSGRAYEGGNLRLRIAALAGAACLTSLVVPHHVASASSFTYLGIRPGTMLMRNGEFCTANFVFQESGTVFDPTQQLYLGTAGHCYAVGDVVDAVAVTDGNTAPNVLRIGTVMFNADPVDDFQLIRLDKAVNAWVSPSTAYFGGPTGVYTGPGGVQVTLVGHAGIAAGNLLPREGTLDANFAHTSPTFDWSGPPMVSGDSGGPVSTVGGLAVGAHTDVLTLSMVPADTSGRGPTVSRMMALTGKVLSVCASAAPWREVGCPA